MVPSRGACDITQRFPAHVPFSHLIESLACSVAAVGFFFFISAVFNFFRQTATALPKLTTANSVNHTAMSTAANPRAPGNHRDSADPDVPQESTGPIAADSLAAQSLKQGGDFAADDPNAVPLGVSGSKSTLANTDTSGAVPLPPASSGAEREKLEARGVGSDEKGPGGLKYPDALPDADFQGKHTAGGEYYGGPSSDRQGAGYTTQPAGASDFGATTSTTQSSGSGINTSSSSGAPSGGSALTSTSSTGAAGVRPHVDAAPNYAARVSGAIEPEGTTNQPKGTNLTEGGDIPENKKTFVGAVTGPNDPGRLGEQNFEAINANVPGGGTDRGNEGTRDEQGKEGGQYGVLGSERV